MRTFRDAKIMARALRDDLARRGTTLSHGECLDIVARQFGVADWNVLSARLGAGDPSPRTDPLALPAGWIVWGERYDLYEIGIDAGTACRSGRPAAMVRCRYAADDPAYPRGATGFGTLMQSVVADAFRGHRVRLRADLRTEAVVDSASLWLRVDGQPKQILAFDNMEDRVVDGRLRGTHDWTGRCIVLDVPEAAESLHFGFYLRGAGRVWAGGFDLRVADGEEKPTALRRFLSGPTNLDFAEMGRPAA